MMHVTFVVFIQKRQNPHYGWLMLMGANNKHFLLLLLVLTTMKTFDIAQMESFLWCQVTGMPPMVLIVTSIFHVPRSLWYQHLICLMDQGSVVPCVNISMVPTLHMQCVTTHDSFPHMAWFIIVSGIICMVPKVKTLWFPKPRFGDKCHTSLPHEAIVYCTMFRNPFHIPWFIWANYHKSHGAIWPGDIKVNLDC